MYSSKFFYNILTNNLPETHTGKGRQESHQQVDLVVGQYIQLAGDNFALVLLASLHDSTTLGF